MRLSEMKTQSKLFIFGDDKAQEIIEKCGLKVLLKIDYLPKRNEYESPKKKYIFRNTNEVFDVFKSILQRENPHLV